MCCCNKPTINGQDGYSWDGKNFGVRKPHFAEIIEGDQIIKDFPGRCGAIDSHSHDLRLVKRRGRLHLLVSHGGGYEDIELSAWGDGAKAFEVMPDDPGYWIMLAIHHAQVDARRAAHDAEAKRWRKAAAEKRIRTRKQRGGEYVKVWIEN